MTDPIPIGIDLGTTYSCIAAYKHGKIEIIPDKSGDRLIPSFVYFHPETGRASVGKVAYELSSKCPGNFVRDTKRIIGRKFDDEFLTNYIKSEQSEFSLVRGADGMAAIQVELRSENVIKTPEEVSAEILKYLIDMAKNYVAQNVEEVVLAIPAYFSNAQRKATKRAAEIAGLKVLKLVTEPVAGAIHYVKEKNIDSRLLVLDWGGGTLDVSLIDVSEKVFQVQAVYGDTLLGGRNIDEILFNHFHVPVERLVQYFNRRLMHKCITLKERLSVFDDMQTTIYSYDGDKDLTLSLTRSDFESLISPLFERVLNIVKSGIDDAGWDKSQIDAVVLVGGTTRTPKIVEMLEAFFERNIVKTDLNPDEAVACGACIQAAYLKNQFQHLEKYKITEVTPLSLGLSIAGGLFKVFIKRNSPLPAFGSGVVRTAYNNQSNGRFKIYEGERKNCAYNNKLGEINISGIPAGRAGDVTCLVNFNLDEDGILTVTASQSTSGQEESLVVTMGEFRLSENKVKRTKETAEKMRNEDNVFEEFVSRRKTLKQYCNYILYELDKVSAKDQDYVSDKCNDFKNFIKTLEFTEIEKLELEFNTFYDSIVSILVENNMLKVVTL